MLFHFNRLPRLFFFFFITPIPNPTQNPIAQRIRPEIIDKLISGPENYEFYTNSHFLLQSRGRVRFDRVKCLKLYHQENMAHRKKVINEHNDPSACFFTLTQRN